MFMENIRKAGKKHRKVMLIVVACLCLSLVIGFATMGSLGGGNMSVEDQIAYYEDYVADLQAGTVDTATQGQIAAVYGQLASLYYQNGDTDKYTERSKRANEAYVAYYEAMVAEQRNAEGDNRALLASYLESLSSYYTNLGETEKSTAAKTESLSLQEALNKEYAATAKTEAASAATDADKQYTAAYYLTQLGTVYEAQSKADDAKAAYAEAAGYYEKAAQNAKNDDNKATYLINWGYCLAATDDAAGADAKYEEAIKLAPDNIGIVQPYIGYLLSKGEGITGENVTIAKAKLAEFAQYFTKAGDDKDTYDSLVYTIDLYDQIFNSTSSEENHEGHDHE
ncbi:MAG: hypothetical protein IJP33_01835 [Firmicutes bacterium]|nr:hypothetical protein [Bacillota bacterium]